MVELHTFDALVPLHPQREMKYILVWCETGEVRLLIDDHEFTLQAQEAITITSGQYYFFKESAHATGYVLRFTYDFFCKNNNDVELIFHNGLFCHFDENVIIKAELSGLLAQVAVETLEQRQQYLVVVHSLIEIILVTLNRAKIAQGDEVWRPTALFLKFLDKIRTGFGSEMNLPKLADELGTNVAKLDELSKLHTGKTALNVLHGLLTSEAKRRLIYEKQNVKELAYSLGFTDPFYFSAFFKKQTGQSPKSYRQNTCLSE